MEVIEANHHRTMAQIVGANVRQVRETRGWTMRHLLYELKRRKFVISKSSLERLEKGEAKWGEALVPIGLALGVAPLVLLMPPAGVTIAASAGVPLEDDYSLLGDALPGAGELVGVSGAILAHGPWEEEWDPLDLVESEDLRAVKIWEKEHWGQASRVGRDPTPEERRAWDAGEPERQSRARLIARLIPTLDSTIQRRLSATDGDWYTSGVEKAWYLPTWSTQQLVDRAVRFELDTS